MAAAPVTCPGGGLAMNQLTNAPQRAYQICRRCVMDTSDPWIQFSADGTCNHCSDFIANRLEVTAYTKAEAQVDQLGALFDQLRRCRPAGASHDVVVGVSGGVDSSITALLASRAGLRVLAVHVDNGWDTPIALQNVGRVIALAGIDYEVEVLHWNHFKAVQRAFITAGVPDIELPTDIAILAVLHRAARRHGIRTILSGGNVATEGILPAAWMYNVRDSRFSEAIVRRAGLPLQLYTPIKLGFRQELTDRLWYRLRMLYPLNAFRYDKVEARRQLIDAIGWQSYGGKHCESTFTRFCQLIYHPRRHGIDYRRGYLSADICLGLLTREEALSQLRSPAWAQINSDHDVAFVARKLDYTTAELNAAMAAPPLWYSDYPNRQRMLGLAYSIFRRLTGRRKASNF
jgi:hypothetical protein